MAFYFKLYLATLLAFLAIDLFWLGLVARAFYQKHLGYLLAPQTNWLAAVIFYLLFILGIVVFVVLPGLKADSLATTLVHAALFGLITYATYDLTNLATIKDWPVIVTVVDMVWGVVLTTLVSLVSFMVGKWLN
ncbi:MAG: DUF2177 family protein [Anaerolineae bacterium]|nr:DUF2177 family protein [Anaerolineae bacterium]